MKKSIILLMALLLTPLVMSAQKMEYHAIATCLRNMKTLDYGKVSAADLKIEKNGNSALRINGKNYRVLTIDRDIQTDSIQSVQYTVNDDSGREYVVKFNHDIYNKVDLMKYQMIIFDANHPYDWTYYFTNKPKKVEYFFVLFTI